MGKDFLKGKTDERRLSRLILFLGLIVTLALGILSWQSRNLQNDYELKRNEAGAGSYDQELIAYPNGQEKVQMTVTVEERTLTKAQAEQYLKAARNALDEILKGENESLEKITTNLSFTDSVLDGCVAVEWTSYANEYFHSDGTLRADVEVSETVPVKVSAVLTCQEYSEDYEAEVVLWPHKKALELELIELIEENADAESLVLTLPKEYEGGKIIWKRPLDYTFLYFGFFTVAAVVVLKVGAKRDAEQEKKLRAEVYEKEYAQVVSKFTMLLSAGLSVRNAWERIALLSREKISETDSIYKEMNRSLQELQKGMSELEVYEQFGRRVGLIHYKKLMALFISEKKRGSVNLLDGMNQEMLHAWEEQKRKTKQQGEKIGTKLLLPMMGMLAVVFIMILVPAFLSFQL